MFRRKPADPVSGRWLVIGLGNPGREYQASRHNIGFLCLDELARRHPVQVKERGSRSLTARIRLGDREVVLAKPQTMMNLSGLAARTLRDKYRVPLDHIFVIHDDLDLPFGRLRVRGGGGSAGHHGVDSLIQGLGSPAFIRFRVGVDRPVGDGVDYVLSPFTPAEREALPVILERVADAVLFAVAHGLEATMTEFNRG